MDQQDLFDPNMNTYEPIRTDLKSTFNSPMYSYNDIVRERGEAWQRGFNSGWDSARTDYYIRGFLMGGIVVCGMLTLMAFFLGA